MKSGILILNKPSGITSQAAVTRVKRLYGEEKAGHTGTLDPIATGVLPILLGRATKAGEFLLSDDKHYKVGLLLGQETDTEDVTGNILSHYDGKMPEKMSVFAAIQAFVGYGMQIPPMYSALKVGGRKLYEFARRGEEIEREPRKIRIESIGIRTIDKRHYLLDVRCSKGTYMRTLCADIGRKLGTGGTMYSLERCEAGGFPISASVTLAELEEMSQEERDRLLLPIEAAFRNKRAVTLSPFFEKLAAAGQQIYLDKIAFSAQEGEIIRLYAGGIFFALGEVRNFGGKLAIKPIRQFNV